MDEEKKKKSFKEVLWPHKGKDWYKNVVPQGSVPMWLCVLFILFTAWAYYHDTHAYMDVYEHPCDYCNTCGVDHQGFPQPERSYDLTGITWDNNTTRAEG